MSRVLLLVAAAGFIPSTLAQEVKCDQNPIGPTFNEAKPDGFPVTYQAVCCDGWCLAASNSAGSDRSWNDDDFTSAADRLKDGGGGHSQCKTQLCSGNGLIEYETMDATGDGEYHGVVEAFGDTCAGAPGYNGPEC
ncbi:hypothetical protein BDW67DRAFT_178038 [Aspergillus spinulosporus]